MNQEITQHIKAIAQDFHLPRYQEIPNIGLYLEQTAKYVSECFSPLIKDGITNSMISNYVKRGVLENPIKKQYSRDQIACLICITAVKTVLSMEDIKLMFRIQKASYSIQIAYDYFCREFENMLEYTFGLKDAPDAVGVENTDEKFMLRNTVMTAAHAIHLHALFAALHQQESALPAADK